MSYAGSFIAFALQLDSCIARVSGISSNTDRVTLKLPAVAWGTKGKNCLRSATRTLSTLLKINTSVSWYFHYVIEITYFY